ncbi:hypothetical protein [Neobacillus cucumis]|uniref:Uncharacterized protein n=1 Tax=Neobacillus cucumis TaxID=1740721 RepID=A0A2N5H9X4_9BACI|nr:hypothetical protein [Neobacillus cucumis]PLS02322.1 hypothetical protein CVD27_20285 [Neobacillus cucumis]
MRIKDKIKNILIGLFYEDASEISEEAYEKVQKSDRLLINSLGFLFVVNTMIIMILFFTSHFTVYNFFEMGLFVITIAIGLFAWLLGVNNNRLR